MLAGKKQAVKKTSPDKKTTNEKHTRVQSVERALGIVNVLAEEQEAMSLAEIAERHGGRFLLTSREGEGTTVTVSLPNEKRER